MEDHTLRLSCEGGRVNPPSIICCQKCDHVNPVRLLSRESHVHALTRQPAYQGGSEVTAPPLLGRHTAQGRRLPHDRPEGAPLWAGVVPCGERTCGRLTLS